MHVQHAVYITLLYLGTNVILVLNFSTLLLYSIPSANSVKSKLFRTQDVYRKIQKLKENDRPMTSRSCPSKCICLEKSNVRCMFLRLKRVPTSAISNANSVKKL